MSFLKEKNLNPHLYLFALNSKNSIQSDESNLQKISYLVRTRLFDEIEKHTSRLKDLSFPTLSAKLDKARQRTLKQKNDLGDSTIFQRLNQLYDKSIGEDPNFEQIDAGQEKAFKLAKILYDEGKYQRSLDILLLLEKQDRKDDLWLTSTWAKLYCEIILRKEESAKTLESLKKKIEEIEKDDPREKKEISKLIKNYYAQKQQFLYLATFVYFNKARDDDMEKFVDLCTNEKSYFSVVQVSYPQVLRYLTVAIALNKTLHSNRNFDLFKLVEVINRKIIKYRDPFIEFISSLYIDFDFESVADQIEHIKEEIRNDIFLAPFEERIIEGLQFLYFKITCKVYETIPLSDVAKFTGKSIQDAELWILGYIRSTDIQAKIDSINQVVINKKNKQNNSEKYIDVIPNLSTFINSLSRAIANK